MSARSEINPLYQLLAKMTKETPGETPFLEQVGVELNEKGIVRRVFSPPQVKWLLESTVSQDIPEWNSLYSYMTRVYHTFRQLRIEIPVGC